MIRRVTAVLVVLAIAAAVTLAVVAVMSLWARNIAAKMKKLDAELRPVEAETGRCGACDGAGTRIEVFASRGASQGIVTCFRCGGTGKPPPPDRIPDLMPSPLGLQVRQLRDLHRVLR